jgi:tRNA-modifying protein YgfZ
MTGLFQLVKISGDDAADFLQGQITQDVTALAGRASLPAAWCNPQGRVIATMRLLELEGATGLVVPTSLAATVVERLAMYRLRAAVELSISGGDWRAYAVASTDDLDALERAGLLPDAPGIAARRTGQLIAVQAGSSPRVLEVYGPAEAFRERHLAFSQPLSDRDWQLALIAAGVPVIGEASSGKYTPHMLNLDCLGAISFDKGCYTGQEVVARTEYRGRSRRRLMRYRAEAGEVAVGDRLADGSREVGDVINVVPGAGAELLAVVPTDLHQRTLTLGGRPAVPLGLPYALPR